MRRTGSAGPTGPGGEVGRRDAHRPLEVFAAPDAPRAAVLLLHGGRADGLGPPSVLNLPGLRMHPFGFAVTRALRGRPPLLATVRYRCRGWNGARADAAQDAARALDELAAREPGVPVVLVGHSMGGRAALRVGGHPAVRGVVALAPWCPPDERVDQLRGRTVALLHDPRDGVTSAEDTWAFGNRARQAGARVGGYAMPRGGHPMLHGARLWHRLTADLVIALLDAPGNPATAGGTEPDGTTGAATAAALPLIPRPGTRFL
ncbi:alpha/beta fold hydrolase [Streptomyces sp. NPDC053427]|uniref:alpha/beta fold hydrolase n=1 Tax=Streptomyces sp. NPDC053427 TaxID=3365701 RepID=UPI0037D88954